jgi:hypothetical protein
LAQSGVGWKLAPYARAFGGRNDQRFMVRFGGVIVDGGCRLSANIAGFGVEISGADSVGTMRAAELHAAFDAFNTIGFHWMNCTFPESRCRDAMVGQRK